MAMPPTHVPAHFQVLYDIVISIVWIMHCYNVALLIHSLNASVITVLCPYTIIYLCMHVCNNYAVFFYTREGAG